MSKTFELAASLAGRAHTAAVQLHPAVIAANHAGDAHSQVLAASVPTINSTEPPGGASLLKIGGWISWGAFAACVVGVFIIVIKMAMNAHSDRGDGGGQQAGKLFWPLLGCIIGASASGILGAVAA
jgi:hypothetical protein